MISNQDLRKFVEDNPNLVTVRSSINHPDLFVVKYKHKVFYDNLWTPELCEMRGLVVDRDWNVIVRPFTKIFNYQENGTILPNEKPVLWVRKVNGFMAGLTIDVNHGVLVSTTGSLDSDFVTLAKAYLEPVLEKVNLRRYMTYLFEIVDPTDPHIIEEKTGAYLIGGRDTYSGVEMSVRELDYMATQMGVMRPEWGYCTFGDLLKKTKECKHEGFVVRDTLSNNEQLIMKLKSPHYLIKKFLSRVRPQKLTSEWIKNNKQNFDEEFFPILDYIVENNVFFTELDQEGRKAFIELFLSERV